MKFGKEHNFFQDKKILLGLGLVFLILVIYFNTGAHFHPRLADTNPITLSQDPLRSNHQVDTTPIPLLYPGLPWEPVDLGQQTAFFADASTKDLRGTAFAVKVANYRAVSQKVISFYQNNLPEQDWHDSVTVLDHRITPVTSRNFNADVSNLGYVKYAGGKLYGFVLTLDRVNSKFIVYYSDAYKVTPNFPN